MTDHLHPLERRLMLDADFNGDGNADLISHDRSTGAVTVTYLNDKEQAISTQPITTVANTSWQVVQVNDFDDDTKPDLLWRNTSNGRVLLWKMNNRQVVGFKGYPFANLQWELAGSGDSEDAAADNDAGADLLWRNKTDGRNVLWVMNGPAVVRYVQLPREPNQAWQIAGMGEVTRQGNTVDLQVLWRNTTTGENRVWIIDNNQLAQTIALPSLPTAWRVAGFVDADDITDTGDIYWRNYTTGQNVAWEFNDGYTNRQSNALPVEPNLNKVLLVGDD